MRSLSDWMHHRNSYVSLKRPNTAKGKAMETSEVQTLEKANAILRTWTYRHNQAAVLIAIPFVVGFVMITFIPSAFSDIVLAVAPVISLTTGIFMIPEDFRTRRGSLNSAFCLVAAMWVGAVIVALVRLLG